MIEIFESINKKEIAQKIKEFEETHKVTSYQYSTCLYQAGITSKPWHCVMVTYKD